MGQSKVVLEAARDLERAQMRVADTAMMLVEAMEGGGTNLRYASFEWDDMRKAVADWRRHSERYMRILHAEATITIVAEG